MEFAGTLADDALYAVSQSLLVPVVAALLLLALYALYSVGSLVVEYAVERRHYRVQLPALIKAVDAADPRAIDGIIGESGLLASQKEALLELAADGYLPEDAQVEVAKRLLADESARYGRAVGHGEAVVKVAPMLGLMGTLIPLGPGIVGLSSGDLTTLSSSLLMAFDTTVVGLAVAVVCFLVTRCRRGWYADYVNNLEGVMNTLLEKARLRGAQEGECILRAAHGAQSERSADAQVVKRGRPQAEECGSGREPSSGEGGARNA